MYVRRAAKPANSDEMPRRDRLSARSGCLELF
jgi:hypothetical protein